MDYLIGVDVGTTSTKAVLYDQQANVLQDFKQGYSLYRDANGMAEQNPDTLVEAVQSVIKQAAQAADLDQGKLLAVSFSSANQSLILLDDKHQPLTRALTWADTRARAVADQLKRTPAGKQLYASTGTPIHPMSPLTKLLWLKQAHPDLMAKASYFADIKSYLFYKLFGVFRFDVSIASCTGMLNVTTGNWDERALALTGVQPEQLPEVVSGTTQEIGLLPDAASAITIGTSAAVRVVTDHPVIDPKQRLFCYAVDNGLWVVGGPLNNGGDVFQWAVEHLVDASAVQNEQVDAYELANDVIASVPAGAHGLLFHPFLGGERAPLWDANARGSFFGLSQLHTRADMLRAVMEGINMNIATVFTAVADLVGEPRTVTATGGFANSEVWRQMLADVLNCPVNIPNSFESGCLGAITMAMVSLGMVDDLSAVTKLVGEVKSYHPDLTSVATYQKYLPVFRQVEGLLSPAYSTIANLQED